MEFVQLLFDFGPVDVSENNRRRNVRRNMFSDFIRRSGYIPRTALDVIAHRDFDLSYDDVDQCIANAFNNGGSMISDEKKKEIVDHMLAHDRYWANYDENARREREALKRIEEEKKKRRLEKIQSVLGAGLCFVMMVVNLFPFAGALAAASGIIGFFTGSEGAGRLFLTGLFLLSVKPVFGFLFIKLIERRS